jgi:hypothetical protein
MAVLKPVSVGGSRQGLLALLQADLHRHVGAPLDDAAMLLVHAPAIWPATTQIVAAPARATA